MPCVRNVPCGKGWRQMAKTKSVPKSRKLKQIKENAEERVPKCIDTGKIMALKRAGWTDKDIAVEMRMEPAVVAIVIRKCIRRHLAEGGL